MPCLRMSVQHPYFEPPESAFNVRIDKISYITKLRLKILRELNKIKNVYSVSSEDQAIAIYNEFGSKNPEIEEVFEEDNDILSFWMLKFALSSATESANWHLEAEECLMLARQPERQEIVSSILDQNIQLENASQVDFGESEDLADLFIEANQNSEVTSVEDFNTLSYAIPTFNFTIIGSRFFVFNGYQKTALNLARFGQKYNENLAECEEFCEIVQDNDFLGFLKVLELERLGQEYSLQETGEVSLKQFSEEIKKGAVPPCMLRLVREMEKDSHLLHEGRLQLELFLKDAGVPMEDAIMLFQEAFTKKMPIDKFQKEYEYYIKHVYGKVGQGGKSHCFGCEKIQQSVPANGEFHGCPFRAMSANAVAALVCRETGVDLEDMLKEIEQPMAMKEYCSACNHMFFRLFGTGMDFVNPIQWITCARRRLEEKQAQTGEKE